MLYNTMSFAKCTIFNCLIFQRISPKLMPSKSQFSMTNKFGNVAKKKKKKGKGRGWDSQKKAAVKIFSTKVSM